MNRYSYYLSKFSILGVVNIFVMLFGVSVLSYSGHGGQVAIAMILTMAYVKSRNYKSTVEFSLEKEDKLFVYAVLLFVLVQLFGVYYQPNGFEYDSLREQFKAFDYPSRWLLLLPVFYLLRLYPINWKLLAGGLAFGVIISVSIAHYQIYYLDIKRPYSVFHGSIPFGELMVVVDVLLWMLMTYAWEQKQKVISIFLFIACIVAFYGSLLSVTRGAWLAYVCMIMVWLVYSMKKYLFNFSSLFSKQVLLRILLCISVYLVVLQTEQFGELKYKSVRVFDNLSQGEFANALEGRYEVGETSFRIIKDYPFGVGTDNFLSANKKYRIRASNTGQDYRNHAHNEFLNLWVENGIQGVLSLFFLLGLALKLFFKNLKSKNKLVGIYSTCGILLIFCYAIFGLTQAVFSHHSTLIFFIFYLYFFFSQVQLMCIKGS